MRLRRLIVHGFKSFRDRTTIHFDDGITGIVGPNGCGKSNIADALFWVMGEKSAKHLRGKSMQDVIFSGSSKYNPATWAEVTLVLGNEEKKYIHIGSKVVAPDEIQISRKLYRNSETEYRINGMPCRLKDIQEIFMDTGAGAKSYSIIAQGEVERLVQAKPQERRSIIEEVAGISKFKLRKRESLRKIEQTETNLVRLGDLKTEIEKNLGVLRRQAEVAIKARSLKEKIKRNELLVDSNKVYNCLKSIRESSTFIAEKNIETEAWAVKRNALEIGLADEQLKRDEQNQIIEELQTQFNHFSKELAASEERLNYLKKNLQEKEKLVLERKSEVSEISGELTGRNDRLSDLKAELEELEIFAQEDHDFSELEDKVSILKDEVQTKDTEYREITKKVEDEKSELSKLENELFKIQSRLDEYKANFEDITSEIESIEIKHSGISSRIDDERSAALQLKNLVENLEESQNELRENIEILSKKNRDFQKELGIKSKEIVQIESKRNSLIELSKSLEDVKEGVSQFLKSENSEDVHLIGNLIKCDQVYTKAVQNLLAEFMDALISSNETPENLYDWCSENSDKGLDFLSFDGAFEGQNEVYERLKLNGPSNIRSLSEVIDVPENFKDKLLPFLEGYYLADDVEIETFKNLSCAIGFKAIASTNGEVLIRNVGGGKILSLDPASSDDLGRVARNNKIAVLGDQLVILEAEYNKLEDESRECEVDLEEKEQKYEALRNQLADARTEYASKKSVLDSRVEGLESGNARLDILKTRKSEVSAKRLEILETEDQLNSNIEQLKISLSEIETVRSDLFEVLTLIKSTYEEEKNTLLEKQVEARSVEQRLKSLNSQIEDVDGQIERLNNRYESNTNLVEKYSGEIEAICLESEELDEENKGRVAVLQERQDHLGQQKDSFNQLNSSMLEREELVKELTKSISKTEKKLVEHELKLEQNIEVEEQVVKNVFEKYRTDLRECVGNFINYEQEDYSKLKDISSIFEMETKEGIVRIKKGFYDFNPRRPKEVAEVGQKLEKQNSEYYALGEINWQAIEDYERQKKRFDFLKEQDRELRLSLFDLEAAISQIDGKSRERFKEAFQEVSVRFERVFPIIFGGGTASLQVVGDITDPECGVDIVAQLPGKKTRSVGLMSGGEKALTAVSLIFSIFLVKPSPFCLLDEVDAPLDDANVGRFNELLKEMSLESQFILITHNKGSMEMNNNLYGITMQEPGVSKAVSVTLQ